MLNQAELQLDALSVLNAVPGNFLILAPDAPRFTILGGTDSYLQATYTKREDIVGKGMFDAFPDNPKLNNATGVQNLSGSLHYVVRHKKEHRMEDQRYDVINPQKGDFEYKVWSPLNKPVLDSKGEVQYIIHTVEDISSRIQLDQALKDIDAGRKVQESEARFRSLLKAAPIGIGLLMGRDLIIEMVNETMISLLGKGDAVVGKSFFEAMPELENQPVSKILADVYASGKIFKTTETPVYVAHDGVLKHGYYDFSYTPLFDAEGGVYAILNIATEVTDRVLAKQRIEEVVEQRTKALAQANDALVKANQELNRSNQNLEQFAYAASHDLKEPIRKIRTFSERLNSSLSERLTEGEKHYFKRMELASKRMGTLIDDLLMYSEVSQATDLQEAVDLNFVIDLVLSDLDLEIEQKGASIRVDKLFTIKGNPRQLQQAFQNLIGNALKYGKPGVAPAIAVLCSKVHGGETGSQLTPEEMAKEYYQVRIEDNGIGFEQEHADRIFNVFTRLHGMAEYKGTGVGLSIVRKVIESHNGYIWAESEPGQGATFKVLLPIA